MTERACRTCRFFEPSSTLQRGWCRNPRLYGPKFSHPVDERSLDCDQGAGDFWEPALPAAPVSGRAATSRVDQVAVYPVEREAASMANTEDGPVERAERNPRDTRQQRSAGMERARVTGRGEADRSAHPAEERYWTDYLRVALPVMGLLLLVGLLWYWASAIVGDNSAEAPVEPSAIALVTPIAPATPPAVAPTTVLVQPTPGLPPAAVGTQPAVVGVPTQAVIVPPTPPVITPIAQATQQPQQPPAVDPNNPCAGLPTYDVGTTIATTDEVNLRDAPSTEGAAIRVLPPGTQLVTSGEAVEAGQCDWLPVTVAESGESGYVIEQYVRLGEQ